MATYLHVIFFSLIGGLFSLIGGLLLLGRKQAAQRVVIYATPFAAGALLAAAFIDLIPESAAYSSIESASLWVLGGILGFFLLEHFLHWFHHHHEHENAIKKSTAPLIIVGDTLHNLLDGVAIGAAFLIDVPTGIVASVAVAAHEIPQEIGDFGLLLAAGIERKRVILINVVSALMATVGAVVTFWIGDQSSVPVGALLGLTAGMFIYIASSDIIPHLHAVNKQKRSNISVALLFAGLAVVGTTTTIAHRYIDAGHSHEASHEEHDHSEDEQSKTPHPHSGTLTLEDHETLPGIEISLKKDMKAGYNLSIETTNFEFSAADVGSDAVMGKGHAHIYVNGEKVARVYAPDFHLDKVKEGDIVRVTLNANDH